MNYEIYCDESCPEGFVRKDSHKFVGIGGVWIPSEYRDELKKNINQIKSEHKITKEFKWNKLSPAFYKFYHEIIDYFFSEENIRSRVIIVETSIIDNVKFHQSDAELSFYKFYYQLLNKWILDFNEYSIFLDLKSNKNKHRIKDLWRVLQNSNLSSTINNVQALPSEQSIGIQFADLITGIVTAKFNKENTSKAKLDLISDIENKIKREIGHTLKSEEKFNVFRINLKGGW